ncbi:prephenate dehydratase [Paludibacter sp. 221]|uniref:prephenate dehydratase n=1 Tax=Paludibacter sp. 221 TaxID=2302939 RepID=UPI0013D401E2|nr:prephenate dehydratase [Paludibacter sp. 221]NDV46742.1 prephenate dehydratase [Paludibacter sp. 221]
MKRVAIQGVSGAFHEIAARQYFQGEEIEIVPCNTFKDLFHELENDKELLGIVAIENTIAGSLLQNHNLLRESGCLIVGEHKLRIEHNLAVLPGQKLEDIKEVHSHPIALMQCEDFLDKHKHMKAIENEDTALSAKEVAEKGLKGVGAICSALAAEKYGLEIIAEGIETNKRNFTRFLMVAQPEKAHQMTDINKVDKATLVFTLPHEEGSLSKVLTILSFYKNNLTKIQSLPIIGKEWEYQFYINLTFDDYTRYRQSLDAIRPLVSDFQNMGEYKAQGNAAVQTLTNKKIG